MATNNKISLTRYLVEHQRVHNLIPSDLRLLLEVVARACKGISQAVNKGALGGVLGAAKTENVQGEIQKQLDIIANEVLIEANEWGGHLAAMASEEMEGIYVVPHRYPQGEYLLLFDPLDGSSNVDVNVSIGTIFSIYRKKTPGDEVTTEDLLQKASEQVAAGYIIYGPSTLFIYTSGNGVHGFTLDPTLGEFFLSHPNLRIPRQGSWYSINEGNVEKWTDKQKRLVDYLKEKDPETHRPYKLRYIGSLVADFHRTLLKGGIFMYPGDRNSPEGKLRFQFEAAPLAFVVANAGGTASDGVKRIMDHTPGDIHEKSPLFIGSVNEVELAESMLK